MNHRNPISLRALLLLLMAVGPLQAQTIFACAMMDTVVHEPCCCDEQDAGKDEAQADADVVLESAEDPCCERSVRITVDQDAGQATSINKSAELRSNADAPQFLFSSIDAFNPPQPVVTAGGSHLSPAASHSASDTWLITQRLRI